MAVCERLSSAAKCVTKCSEGPTQLEVPSPEGPAQPAAEIPADKFVSQEITHAEASRPMDAAPADGKDNMARSGTIVPFLLEMFKDSIRRELSQHLGEALLKGIPLPKILGHDFTLRLSLKTPVTDTSSVIRSMEIVTSQLESWDADTVMIEQLLHPAGPWTVVSLADNSVEQREIVAKVYATLRVTTLRVV